MELKYYWSKKKHFLLDYSPIFSDMTVQRNVSRFCTRSIYGWNLFLPLGLTSNQHWFRASCFLGYFSQWPSIIYETLTRCRLNVGPPSVMPAQQWVNIGSTSRVLWATERYAQQTQTICIKFDNVGPTLKTLGRRCINVIQMFCVCWVVGDSLTNACSYCWPQ